MSRLAIAGLGVLGAALAGLAGWLLWRRTLPPVRAEAVIVDPEDHTVLNEDGAVRSIQAADLIVPEDELVEIWSPHYLERLARTYWRFLTRSTLGLIRVVYTERERYVVFLCRPFVLLSFQAPEYEIGENRGIVRWRIDKGILVSRRGRGGDGYLEIDVTRRESDRPGYAVVHVEVEVANFYPAIASGIATWVYKITQSKIHVIVTHGFLRSLARMDFAESRVGRFATPAPEDTPSPRRERLAKPRGG
jgi:hypothetical protein